jgi:hypothetical protein
MSLVDPSSTPLTPVKDPHSPIGSFPPRTESPPSAEELRDGNSDHNEPASDPEPEPEPDPVQIAAEAEKLKERGNDSFKCGRYGEAIDLYTKAIGTSSASPPPPVQGAPPPARDVAVATAN